ncbi:hypothetical protein INH39_12880 [Massilia violaceinigra]|uniref:Uncharacterized protein n=1 Tax=Massilia violaceinigra TaxID=2045208 RepID=A0ABY4ACG4_9BURK|nr:hypothetical protein [Massilia violaceinigra]UOD32462.1 hypothetical protein INH39_12880 [Massilia violaceinigra]
MSWNYRVMHKAGQLAVYSVYYDDDGKVISSSILPEAPSGETLEALRHCCALYMDALTKPVLDYVE